MKHMLKRILAFSVVCILFSFQVVLAEKEINPESQNKTEAETQSIVTSDLPLYEKFGYQEDFQYTDEMIGHALKSTVVYITQECNFTITYRPLLFHTDNLNALLKIYPNIPKETILAFVLKNHRDYFQYGDAVF